MIGDYITVFRQILYGPLTTAMATPVYIVETNNGEPVPPEPFVTINPVSFTPQDGYGWIEKKLVDNDPLATFPQDFEETQTTEDVISLSVTAHAKTFIEAQTIAETTHNMIEFINQQDFSDEGYQLITVLPLQNRTVYLTEDYLHRFGFDVSYRVQREVKRRLDTIETVIINDEEVDI